MEFNGIFMMRSKANIPISQKFESMMQFEYLDEWQSTRRGVRTHKSFLENGCEACSGCEFMFLSAPRYLLDLLFDCNNGLSSSSEAFGGFGVGASIFGEVSVQR